MCVHVLTGGQLYGHIYTRVCEHECAQVCTGAQGAVHVGAHMCKYGCTQKCSHVFACGHTPSAHTCAEVSVHKRAQACTSAPVGVCAHVCVCWPAPCTLSSPHGRREHTHTARCARLASRRANTRVCAHTAVPLQNGFAVIRPPGHHAEESAAM